MGYDIEYIPRTTMLYRMHSTSVSSNSLRRGQDLIEQLEIFETYEARTLGRTGVKGLHRFEARS